MDPPNDTQPLDTQVWEHLGYQRAGNTSSPVRNPTAPDFPQTTEDECHDIMSETQLHLRDGPHTVSQHDEAIDPLQFANSEIVTSPAAFSPTTPGNLAQKNDRNMGNGLSSASRTPAANLNGIFSNPGTTVGLSQIFRQTQARSSPVPNETASEAIFEQPSQDFVHPERATSESAHTRSVARSNVKDMLDTEISKGHYVSLKESQQLRERLLTLRENISHSPTAGDGHGWRNRVWQQDVPGPKRDHEVHHGKLDKQTLLTSAGIKRRKLASPASVVGDVGIITPASHIKRSLPWDGDCFIDSLNPHAWSYDNSDKDSRVTTTISRDHKAKGTSTSEKALNGTASTKTTSNRARRSSSSSDRNFTAHQSQTSTPHDQSIRQVMATQNSRTTNSPYSSSPGANETDTIANSQIGKPSFILAEHSASPVADDAPAIVPETSIVRPQFMPDLNMVEKSNQERTLPMSSSHENIPSSPPPIRKSRSTMAKASSLAENATNLDSTAEVSGGNIVMQESPRKIFGQSSPSENPLVSVPAQNKPAHGLAESLLGASLLADSQIDIDNNLSIGQTEDLSKAGKGPDALLESDGNFYTASETRTSPRQSGQITRQPSRLSNQSSQNGTIRKLADFESNASPQNSQVDLPFAALDHDDMAFQDAMSPRKFRNRRTYGSRRRVLDEQEHTSMVSRVVPSEVQGLLSTNKSTSGQIKNSDFDSGLLEDHAQGGEPPSLHSQQGFSTLKTDATRSKQSVPPVARKLQSVVPPLTDETRIFYESKGNKDVRPTEQITEEPVQSSRRVFASGPGEFDHYYPGTVLSVHGEDNRLVQVRLDDGRVLDKQVRDIRRLELHLGDKINVNLNGGVANTTWAIKEFQTRGSGKALNEQQRHTDVFGNSDVILEVYARQRTGTNPSVSLGPVRVEQVAIENLYVKHDLWFQFDDRQFLDFPNDLENDEGASPSDEPVMLSSLPTTPTARRRRGATALPEKGHITSGPQAARCTTNSQLLGKNGIFASMVFAISYSTNLQHERESISELIISHGGRILHDGFDKLFHLPLVKPQGKDQTSHIDAADGFCLNQSASDLGFVALIADTYSRRAKYMQALALNIPCLHGRWILDSVQEHSLRPWEIYSLPAGESVYLGGAIRNRDFPDRLPAEKCKLLDTIAARPRLLQGMCVILVVGKSKKAEERRYAYLFLTHALGAKVVLRVPDLGAAKEAIAETQHKWDWIYVNDQRQKADAEAFVLASLEKGQTRKRALKVEKGTRTGHVRLNQTDPSRQSIKVVDDEFVIQSLILGTLIES